MNKLVIALLALTVASLASTAQTVQAPTQVPMSDWLQYMVSFGSKNPHIHSDSTAPAGALTLPTLLVYGRDGCFIGSYPTGTTKELSAGTCATGTGYASVPKFIHSQVDSKIGGVVLLKAGGQRVCKSCDELKTAGLSFANSSRPARRFSEVEILMNHAK